MAELANFVHHGTAMITPRVLKNVHKKLPMLKLEFAGIQDPKYPHLSEQLAFLANIVEDFAEGQAEDLPYATAAAATFALVYCHRQFHLIPNWIPEFGRADDSGVTRVVLIEHEKVLAQYADAHKLSWNKVTFKP